MSRAAAVARAWPVGIAVLALGADLKLKDWARAALAGGDVELFPALSLRLRYNAGTTLDILSGSLGLYVAALLAGLMLILALWTAGSSRWVAVAAALIAAGAAGNLIDRLLVGMVTDFVALRWGSWQAPIFNPADVLMVAGVALLIVMPFRGGS